MRRDRAAGLNRREVRVGYARLMAVRAQVAASGVECAPAKKAHGRPSPQAEVLVRVRPVAREAVDVRRVIHVQVISAYLLHKPLMGMAVLAW